mgnify:CR=1 FL=1
MPNYFYVQDQGVFIPTNDLAQAFAAINFVQTNSLGVGTDTLIPNSLDKSLQNTFVFKIVTLEKKRSELKHRGVF